MGDVRFEAPYERVRTAEHRAETIQRMSDEDLIAALAGASRGGDPLLANVLATAAQNRLGRLHMIIENMGEGVILLDAEGHGVTLNPSAQRLLGWSLEQMKDIHVHELLHPACREGEECPLVQAFVRPIEVQRDEETLARADAAQVPAAYCITSLQREGAVEGAVLLVRDMAEHRRAVEATTRLAATIEASQDAIYTVTPAGVITTWNPAAQRIYGWRTEEAIGRHVSLLFPPDAGHELGLVMDMVMREGRGLTFETRRRRKDGDMIEVSVSTSPMTDPRSGGVIGASVSSRDVTARKRDEQLLRSVLEAAPTAMVVSDEAGRIILVNSAAERLFGYGKGELAWREIEDLVPHRLRGAHRLHRTSFNANPHARPMGAGLDLGALRKDGSEFPVEISLSPAFVRLDGGPGSRFVTVAVIRETGAPARGHSVAGRDAPMTDHGMEAPR